MLTTPVAAPAPALQRRDPPRRPPAFANTYAPARRRACVRAKRSLTGPDGPVEERSRPYTSAAGRGGRGAAPDDLQAAVVPDGAAGVAPAPRAPSRRHGAAHRAA